ncbi:cytochrome c, partial [Nonlabens mediterrranea]|nr:cytochrome c [Nonlabens mediterrranea]
LYKKAVGPALHEVSQKYDREWLYKWISNSAALIASGDAQAIAVYNEYNQTAMNAFPQLSNVDIDNILAYTDTPKPAPAAAVAGATGDVQPGGASDNTLNSIVLAALALILVLLVALLFVVNSTLKRFADANGIQTDFEDEKEVRRPLWKAFAENQFLVLVSAVFLLLASAY